MGIIKIDYTLFAYMWAEGLAAIAAFVVCSSS